MEKKKLFEKLEKTKNGKNNENEDMHYPFQKHKPEHKLGEDDVMPKFDEDISLGRSPIKGSKASPEDIKRIIENPLVQRDKMKPSKKDYKGFTPDPDHFKPSGYDNNDDCF